ncbi:MAG: hypothetical protein CSA81_02200 [Acidobacteria bacterium]|nr:MAG: hypothetical protein CSA81_02200 [Acidobacteriota bacterium]
MCFCFLFFYISLAFSTFENPIPLKSFKIIDSEDSNYYIVAIERYRDIGLVLNAKHDKQVWFFDFTSKKSNLIAVEGRGPGELNGGPFSIGIFGEDILIRDRAAVYSLYGKAGFKGVLHDHHCKDNSMFLNSLIKIDENTAFASSGSVFKVDGKYHLLGKLKKTDREKWCVTDWLMSEKTVQGDDFNSKSFRMTYSAFIKLCPASTEGTFYFVPMFLGSVITVLDRHGRLIREIQHPHPLSRYLPRSPDDLLSFFQDKDHEIPLVLGKSAFSDANGLLHILMNKKDTSIIVSLDEFGNRVNVMQSKERIISAVPSCQGDAYFGLDEDGNVYHLMPTQ